MAIAGARLARPTWWRRLAARAIARDLTTFVVPGAEVARAQGLDLAAAGLRLVPTPRHASVLLVVGELPAGLARAAAVAYARMPRPRAVLATGTRDVAPVPTPDVVTALDQQALARGVATLRGLVASGAFDPDAAAFDVPAVRMETEYTCPMHPEVVRDTPGRCPKCGMDLVPRERAGGASDHAPMDHAAMKHAAPPSSDGGDKHESMGHDPARGDGFMSMVAITKDLPRSRDGLPMEWIDAPFGPLFPGLPGGLGLTLTLDGDEVAAVTLGPGVASRGLAATWPGEVATFPARLARLDPEARIAYRLLALRAIESATATGSDDETARRWIGALERERALSHLNWLAGWGLLLGTSWLANRAAALRLALSRVVDMDGLVPVAASIGSFTGRVERLPLLRQRLAGSGELPAGAPLPLRGPIARASTTPVDARCAEPAYQALGFEPCVIAGGDALARLRVRLAELNQSLALIRAAGTLAPPDATPSLAATAGDSARKTLEGCATVETARGAASLTLKIVDGMVREVALDLPSVAHAGLLDAVATGHELADALTGIASLDLSPWELGA